MSKLVDLNLPIITQSHVSGFTLARVSGDLTTLWPNQQSHYIALAFQSAAQKKLINEGEYDKVYRYLNNHPPHLDTFTVTVPANKKRFDFEAHDISFDFVYWVYDGEDIFGFAPAIGVANFAKTIDELKKNLKETVLLEFQRNKRLTSQHSLISKQWYTPPVVHHHPIQLEFYTPSELMQKRQGQKENIVGKTARHITYTRMSAIGLDDYVDDLRKNLLGPYRQSVLIVGPNGCGKTALIQEFFRQHKMEFQRIPWQTTAAQLLRVLTEEGGWQYGLGQWVAELRRSADLMYVGNYAELFEVGQYAGSSVSIGDALRDGLQRNEMALIGELTEEQLEKIDLRSPGYSQLFHIVRFSERSTEEENRITSLAVKGLCELLKVGASPDAIKRIISLHRRYAPYSGYPGKTIRFFESLLLQAPKQTTTISEQAAIGAFCDESGMPPFLVDTDIPFKASQAKRFFEERVIGQHRAVDEVINGLLTVKSGMARSGKPITSALFVGPTGVGKTQIAKTLAEYIFGDAKRMVRFDMSEYSDPYSVTRLTAASEASLVTKVRQQPFAIVLFDEIEKADTSFFDLLLQVLDEGRLTDDKGEIANFCSTIVIMTSNIGGQSFSANKMGFTQNESGNTLEAHFEEAVTQHFRPELFNRIELVVPFSPLTSQEQEAVIRKEIGDLTRVPGVISRPVKLTLSESIYPILAQDIRSSKYGARAIQRIIQQRISWPLAEVLAQYKQNAPLTIEISSTNNSITIVERLANSELKETSTLLEIADDAAAHRTMVQALENGGTWISLLSHLDQLEAIKKRKKESFWQDLTLVSDYETYRSLSAQFDTLLTEAFSIEEQALTCLLDEDAGLFVQDFDAMILGAQETFVQLLVTIDSISNPHHNEASLYLYGAEQDVSFIEQQYIRWFKALTLDYQIQYIYVKTAPDTVTDTPAEEEQPKKEDDEEDLTEETLDNDIYPLLSKPSQQKNHQLIGKALTIKGPSVGLFFIQEVGIWQLESEEQKKSLMSVDVYLGLKDEYEVPQGIHRKKYYSSTKPKRRVKDFGYSDKRFGSSDYKPLTKHAEQMQELRYKSLLATHLNQSFLVIQEKES